MLSKVLPESNIAHHRVDGVDSASPGGRRAGPLLALSTPPFQSHNAQDSYLEKLRLRPAFSPIHQGLNVQPFNFKPRPLLWPPTTVSVPSTSSLFQPFPPSSLQNPSDTMPPNSFSLFLSPPPMPAMLLPGPLTPTRSRSWMLVFRGHDSPLPGST